MKTLLLVLLACLVVPVAGFATLGETEEEIEKRYGNRKPVNHPVLKKLAPFIEVKHEYQVGSTVVGVFFLRGKCVYEVFIKADSFSDAEMEDILRLNTPAGTKWTVFSAKDKVWRRSDGIFGGQSKKSYGYLFSVTAEEFGDAVAIYAKGTTAAAGYPHLGQNEREVAACCGFVLHTRKTSDDTTCDYDKAGFEVSVTYKNHRATTIFFSKNVDFTHGEVEELLAANAENNMTWLRVRTGDKDKMQWVRSDEKVDVFYYKMIDKFYLMFDERK